ncbi:MarR family transcriptional regulator [Aurantimonas aggregata]|uniref:MarR family transcriptional regulator n=1 Tax=Aurantimonas aggregata TaxID=2047720 RepID=A0A6L9MBT8_9HYPH|nr:MarR family winged helix-turn-helix transcriptional regulator [Aurantimonas aggregata]NDV85304.1 MarR family transcriptional regulator [Aurantimonas aggregata]
MTATGDSDRSLFLSSRLIRAATALGRVTSQVHKGQHGLTLPEFSVLMILGGEDGAQTSSYIVETTAMDKTKVSRAVSSLDRRKWLQRTRATSDRRFEYLALTPAGRAAYAQLVPKVETAENTVLKNLTKEEISGLERGLAGLDRAFGERP